MTVFTFIPARMAASRFPNKPLAKILDKPMIQHVYEGAQRAIGIDKIYAACGDVELVEAVKAFGGEAVFTDPALPSGTDRVWAAYQSLPDSEKSADDIIVNLQGDIPFFNPEMVSEVISVLKSQPDFDFATVCALLDDPEKAVHPSTVKIAMAGTENPHQPMRALYFSRSVIPHGEGPLFHHFGIYAYRPQALEAFVNTPASPLEKREKLEQLRALEAGLVCGVAVVDAMSLEVNHPEDIPMVEAALQDPLRKIS